MSAFLAFIGLRGLIAIALAALLGVQAFTHSRQIDRKDTALSAASSALSIAARDLRIAGDAVRQQNAANARRIAEAATARVQADQAGVVAAAAERRRDALERAHDARVDAAMRSPTCAALLSADITKECGL